jgi:hypothetical protein
MEMQNTISSFKIELICVLTTLLYIKYLLFATSCASCFIGMHTFIQKLLLKACYILGTRALAVKKWINISVFMDLTSSGPQAKM